MQAMSPRRRFGFHIITKPKKIETRQRSLRSYGMKQASDIRISYMIKKEIQGYKKIEGLDRECYFGVAKPQFRASYRCAMFNIEKDNQRLREQELALFNRQPAPKARFIFTKLPGCYEDI